MTRGNSAFEVKSDFTDSVALPLPGGADGGPGRRAFKFKLAAACVGTGLSRPGRGQPETVREVRDAARASRDSARAWASMALRRNSKAQDSTGSLTARLHPSH